MKFRSLRALLSLALILQGCTTLNGARWAVDSDGVFTDKDKKLFHAPPGTYAAAQQTDAASKNYMTARDFGFPTLYSLSAGNPNEAAAAKRLLDAGYAVIDSNCEAYFQSEGSTQKWIFATRDAIGAIGTLATGVMGALGAGTTSVAWVGLSTAGAYNGLDIYSKHFLFGSDNIDLVHTLVSEQLLAEQKSFMTQNPPSQLTFYTVRREIFANQIVCSDAHILTLVRNAIKKGALTATSQSDDAKQQVMALDPNYQQGLVTLGDKLNPSSHSIATDDQARAVVWLYSLAPSTAEEFLRIRNLLGNDDLNLLPTDAQIAARNFAGTATASTRDGVKNEVSKLIQTNGGKILRTGVQLEQQGVRERIAQDVRDYASAMTQLGALLHPDSHQDASTDEAEGLLRLYVLNMRTPADLAKAGALLQNAQLKLVQSNAATPDLSGKTASFLDPLGLLVSTKQGAVILEKAKQPAPPLPPPPAPQPGPVPPPGAQAQPSAGQQTQAPLPPPN